MTGVSQGWRKSSYSRALGGCVEIGQDRTEVGQDAPVIGVRDSKLPSSPVLVFNGAAWQAFTEEVRDVGFP